MTFSRVFLVTAILFAVLLAACGDSPAEALPRLDDPKEILEEACGPLPSSSSCTRASRPAPRPRANPSPTRWTAISTSRNASSTRPWTWKAAPACSNVPRSCSSAPTCSCARRIPPWAGGRRPLAAHPDRCRQRPAERHSGHAGDRGRPQGAAQRPGDDREARGDGDLWRPAVLPRDVDRRPRGHVAGRQRALLRGTSRERGTSDRSTRPFPRSPSTCWSTRPRGDSCR